MTLSDRLTQLETAAATHNGAAAAETLRAIEDENGPVVAALVTADLVAFGVRVLRERAAGGDADARELLDRAEAIGYAR